MPALLSQSSWPVVRAVIDTSLDAEGLPDSVIAIDAYAGRAERLVLARDPLAPTREGAEFLRVTLAGVLFCAALILRAQPNIAREKIGDFWLEREPWDREATAARLWAEAESEIAIVLDTASEDLRVGAFAVASGSRGW